MPQEATIDYIKRALARLRDTSVAAAQRARLAVTAEATKAGAFQSGRMLMHVSEVYNGEMAAAVEKGIRLAFDAAGTNSELVCATANEGLIAIKDALFDDLAAFYRSQGSWGGSTGKTLGDSFLSTAEKTIEGVVDDFRHGILGGLKLTKDPLVSIVSSITNSPGATQQTGIGNVQAVLPAVADLRAALAQFTQSKEVQALQAEEKAAVIDVAEVIGAELDKPAPDPCKVRRWGRRLLDIAERLGIAVAATGLSHLLF
jgi:hypothetical protein